MTKPFSYVVRAELDSEAIAESYVAWLTGGHVAEVCHLSGARGAVVRLDGDRPRVESRYVFPSRDAFAAYERDHAPRLRAEGVERFGGTARFERSTGDELYTCGEAP